MESLRFQGGWRSRLLSQVAKVVGVVPRAWQPDKSWGRSRYRARHCREALGRDLASNNRGELAHESLF